ncbi:hypothetical protein M3589_24055 [Heyndrickxia oleronia]|uniref:Uncharacterized protein n=1 Tax=Heyndrickxia oleronia TaxID=38875 RepID=A0AAW6T219_9BACI|nr:hypothetical protein [Heyndrickxia oleronia]MCM3240733.1 hypothetical protein [Heyndrickxia oleronia]MDH5163319.1 hypothetical protein [Heyndrickxia oleronia]NYV66502.1 hypothetical protein [Bacillus sp. Gen3]GIN41537.1 hypothetical protein J19TS1_44860 [Heyndrickxia oleronia]
MKIKFLLVFPFLIFLVLIGLKINNVDSVQKDKTENNTTLLETINIANKEAKEWSKDAVLYSAHSEDTRKMVEKDHEKWNLIYGVPQTSKQLLITINHSNITQKINLQNESNDNYINVNDINIDSDEGIVLAKKNGLLSGKGFINGYQISLEKNKNELNLSVYGVDKKGHFSQVVINAKKGSVIYSLKKVPSYGGLYTLQGNKSIENNGDQAILGGYFNKKNTELIFWGEEGPQVYLSKPFISKVGEDSKKESKIYLDDRFIKVLPQNDNSEDLYILTPDSLSHYQNGQIKRILTLESKDAIDFAIKENVISVISNNKLYLTTNRGLSWNEYNFEKQLISVSFNKDKIVILTSNKLLIFNSINDNFKEIDIPSLNGIKLTVFQEKLFLYSKDTIWEIDGNFLKLKKIELDISGNINQLITTTDNLFISDGYILYKILKGDDTWKSEKIFIGNGQISTLISKDNELLVGTLPEFNWENLKEDNR